MVRLSRCSFPSTLDGARFFPGQTWGYGPACCAGQGMETGGGMSNACHGRRRRCKLKCPACGRCPARARRRRQVVPEGGGGAPPMWAQSARAC